MEAYHRSFQQHCPTQDLMMHVSFFGKSSCFFGIAFEAAFGPLLDQNCISSTASQANAGQCMILKWLGKFRQPFLQMTSSGCFIVSPLTKEMQQLPEVVFTWKSAIFTCFVGGACVWPFPQWCLRVHFQIGLYSYSCSSLRAISVVLVKVLRLFEGKEGGGVPCDNHAGPMRIYRFTSTSVSRGCGHQGANWLTSPWWTFWTGGQDRLWRSDNGHQRQELQKANDFGRKGKAVTEKDFLGQCSVHSSSSWNCLNFVDFTFSLQWINDWQDLLIRGICLSTSASPFALIFVHRHIISLLFSEE